MSDGKSNAIKWRVNPLRCWIIIYCIVILPLFLRGGEETKQKGYRHTSAELFYIYIKSISRCYSLVILQYGIDVLNIYLIILWQGGGHAQQHKTLPLGYDIIKLSDESNFSNSFHTPSISQHKLCAVYRVFKLYETFKIFHIQFKWQL